MLVLVTKTCCNVVSLNLGIALRFKNVEKNIKIADDAKINKQYGGLQHLCLHFPSNTRFFIRTKYIRT